MASVAERTKAAVARVLNEEIKPPPDVEARLKRGEESMSEGAPKRNECLRFARGRQYTWVDSQNVIREQETTSSYERRSGKARHRVRSVRNYIFDHVAREVSGAMQRIPGYGIAPTSNAPRRVSAARWARKLLYYGYEAWGIRTARARAIRLAIVAQEGFVWPYFDNTVGPFFETDVLDEEGQPTGKKRVMGRGEIRCRVYGPNETFWEPGVRFEDSRWHAIKQARDIDEVMAQEGYVGGKLEPDAQKAETSDLDNAQERLVLETHYLERPSPRRPKGRWIVMANSKVIVNAQPYPCRDHEGKILDEPILHQLYYEEDADSDRNLGLVEQLIPAQRQLNHAVSKIAEWVNLALNPQMLIINGKILSGKLNDVPGAQVRVAGAGEVKWREIPPIPPELFKQKEEAIVDMARIAAQNDIPNQVESAKGIQFLTEKDAGRRNTFYTNLAAFDERLGRHCLYLAQRHYTEPRLLQLRGEDGSLEPVGDFLGAQILGEVDVRVSPESVEPVTREVIEQKILAFADRGWISPHEAMAAINKGTAEGLVQSYERDIARANLIIQKCREGPEVLFATPRRRPFFGEDPGFDEETGEPREYIPGWMPRPFDNVAVQKDTVADFMKGSEYEDLDPPSQEAMNAVYDSYLQLEAKHQAQEAAAQEMTAESLGMSNAARPSAPPPLPDQAPLNGR